MIEKKIDEIKLPHRFKSKLISDIDLLLKYEGINIDQIILFGSCARDTYKVTSDIDLLIITKETVDRMTRGTIASILDEAVDEVTTDIVFYSKEVFKRSESLFIKKIKEEGIIIK